MDAEPRQTTDTDAAGRGAQSLQTRGRKRAAQQLVDEDRAIIRARYVPGRPVSRGQQRRFRVASVAGPTESQPDHQHRWSPLPPNQGTFQTDGLDGRRHDRSRANRLCA
jgi:hypothetical protein